VDETLTGRKKYWSFEKIIRGKKEGGEAEGYNITTLAKGPG